MSIPIGLLVLISLISVSTSLVEVDSKENLDSGFFSFDVAYTDMVFIFCYYIHDSFLMVSLLKRNYLFASGNKNYICEKFILFSY